MGQGDILIIGSILVALGVVFWLATRFLLRAVPGVQTAASLPAPMPFSTRAGQSEALIMVQPGGRVLQLNAPARALLDRKSTRLNSSH